MTPADLPALRATLERMSAAPWSVSGVSTVRSADDSMAATFVDYERHEADADGMCALRNTAAALLDEIERMRGQVKVLTEALEPFHVVITDWYGARGGGQSSMVVYRDEIEAVAAALDGSAK